LQPIGLYDLIAQDHVPQNWSLAEQGARRAHADEQSGLLALSLGTTWLWQHRIAKTSAKDSLMPHGVAILRIS
jgi:hypothetical protein